MRKKIIFSYDGSKFNGLQRQKNTRTVQKTIEEALSKIFEDDIELKASGRTDAGVHAVNQVAHFDIKKDIKGLKHKLNLLLNPDIVVKSVSNVNDDFHATIYEINFVKKFDNKIEVHFIGTGFYRYMIRNLMGALLEVGKYNASKEDLLKMLDTIEEKSLPTAPPEGLYLYKVWY